VGAPLECQPHPQPLRAPAPLQWRVVWCWDPHAACRQSRLWLSAAGPPHAHSYIIGCTSAVALASSPTREAGTPLLRNPEIVVGGGLHSAKETAIGKHLDIGPSYSMSDALHWPWSMAT